MKAARKASGDTGEVGTEEDLWGEMVASSLKTTREIAAGQKEVVSFSFFSSIVYFRLPEPQKLCGMLVAINYTPLSMAYYAYETYS